MLIGGPTDLCCYVCWHHGEEEVLLVLPLALQHDPGLDAVPCLSPVFFSVLSILHDVGKTQTEAPKMTHCLTQYLKYNEESLDREHANHLSVSFKMN